VKKSQKASSKSYVVTFLGHKIWVQHRPLLIKMESLTYNLNSMIYMIFFSQCPKGLGGIYQGYKSFLGT